MIAMIFEFWFDPDDQTVFEEYLAEAAKLRELLPEIDGFEGIERFTSVSEPGKFVAIGFFRDESAKASVLTRANSGLAPSFADLHRF
jgi:heme-degrading monooxygenase HmoA